MDPVRYANLRAEMWFKLAVWLKDRASIPVRADLENDLTAVTYKYDNRNRILLESKEDMKKRGMPSPDVADALAMTFSQPVAPKDMRNLLHGTSQADDYDPLASRSIGRQQTSGEDWRPW